MLKTVQNIVKKAIEAWVISIGNSTVSRGIWDKYSAWYFKIHQNITSRRGKWYLGSFEISRAGIYPKYPEETVLLNFVYTTRQRNFAFYVTHIFLFSHVQLIGFTTTCDLNMWSLKHHTTVIKLYSNVCKSHFQRVKVFNRLISQSLTIICNQFCLWNITPRLEKLLLGFSS